MTNSNNQQLELSFLTQSTVEATPAEMRQELRLEEQQVWEDLKEKQQDLMNIQANVIKWYRDKYISCINQNQRLQSQLLKAQVQNEELNQFIKKHQSSSRYDPDGGRDVNEPKTDDDLQYRFEQQKIQNQIILKRIQRLDRQNRELTDQQEQAQKIIRNMSAQERKDKETIQDLQLQQEQAQKIIRNMSAQEGKDKETTKQLEVEVEMLKSQLEKESKVVKKLQDRLYKVGENIKEAIEKQDNKMN